MSDNMKKNISSLLAGMFFAIGLGVSGMTDTGKVTGFLNVLGDWDPSLAFVMVGGISVHFLLFKFILKRDSPLFHHTFHVPTRKDIDKNLIAGSMIFGLGWGLAGYCPGPGLVSFSGAFQGSWELGSKTVVFVVFMFTGMAVHKLIKTIQEKKELEATC